MPDYIYPQNAVLNEIARDLIVDLVADDPIFQYFPMEDVDAALVMWEQEDNVTDIQQYRGYNSDPPPVIATGIRRFMAEPGVFGERIDLDEREMVERRIPGTFSTAISLEDMVARRQVQLLKRRLDRIRQLAWTLVVDGSVTVLTKSGAVGYTAEFLRQTYSAMTGWGTYATSTPLADLNAVHVKEWGHSVSFGNDAKAFANRKTINNLLLNQNPADIYGRRTSGLGTFNTLELVNGFAMGDNLPVISEYNKGYYAGGVVQDATDFTQYGTDFTPFIPDDTVIVFGARPGGSPVGAIKMTRNAMNPNFAPGPYMKVVDSRNGDDGAPPKIGVEDGWSGGPVILYPSAIVSMAV